MSLDSSIERILQLDIPNYRKEIVRNLVNYIEQKRAANQPVNLNFVCTHNSRRSQFAQIWASVASHAFNISITSLSGGVEVTEFNSRAIQSLERFGFLITGDDSNNSIYSVEYALNVAPLKMFSKLYDDEANQVNQFAAVLTCSHADENCPVIPGSEQRISMNYEDPKEYDDTPQESMMYDERSMQIASEMFYVFSKIK